MCTQLPVIDSAILVQKHRHGVLSYLSHRPELDEIHSNLGQKRASRERRGGERRGERGREGRGERGGEGRLTEPSSSALRSSCKSASGHQTSAMRHLLVTSKLHMFSMW